jgi:predicted DNA-binding transcriptional regulator YafY
MTEAILAVIGYIAFIAIVLRCLRANGDDTDAQDAADSVRAALSDDRLDELRTYTQRPHVRAGSAWGKQP